MEKSVDDVDDKLKAISEKVDTMENLKKFNFGEAVDYAKLYYEYFELEADFGPNHFVKMDAGWIARMWKNASTHEKDKIEKGLGDFITNAEHSWDKYQLLIYISKAFIKRELSIPRNLSAWIRDRLEDHIVSGQKAKKPRRPSVPKERDAMRNDSIARVVRDICEKDLEATANKDNPISACHAVAKAWSMEYVNVSRIYRESIYF